MPSKIFFGYSIFSLSNQVVYTNLFVVRTPQRALLLRSSSSQISRLSYAVPFVFLSWIWLQQYRLFGNLYNLFDILHPLPRCFLIVNLVTTVQIDSQSLQLVWYTAPSSTLFSYREFGYNNRDCLAIFTTCLVYCTLFHVVFLSWIWLQQ